MNLLDLFIVLLVLAALARGVAQGAILQVLPFGGFWVGLLAGSALAPLTARLVSGPGAKVAVSLVTVFGSAMLLSGAGREIGVRAWGALRRARLGFADSALGAVVSGVATLFGIWLLGTILAGLPLQSVSRSIHDSVIMRGLDRLMPPAPQVFSRVRQLIGANGFPDVFAGLEPAPREPVPPPADPDVRAALQAAGGATVRIVGTGCGGIKTGSGFVAGPGLVVTNAHVVAGIDRPVVEDEAGQHDANPVLFDEDLDVAVLRASGLAAGPLSMRGSVVDRGTGGAVIGFPGGGDLRAGPGAVMGDFTATGRDIYGQDLTRRDVYQLQAEIRPGNSGGPFVLSSGEVVGVIFSTSATNPDVGYAITSPEVIPRVRDASGRTQGVDTGPCTA
ncbi:MAG: MarP family serine protease [Actinomycetota bacterium]